MSHGYVSTHEDPGRVRATLQQMANQLPWLTPARFASLEECQRFAKAHGLKMPKGIHKTAAHYVFLFIEAGLASVCAVREGELTLSGEQREQICALGAEWKKKHSAAPCPPPAVLPKPAPQVKEKVRAMRSSGLPSPPPEDWVLAHKGALHPWKMAARHR